MQRPQCSSSSSNFNSRRNGPSSRTKFKQQDELTSSVSSAGSLPDNSGSNFDKLPVQDDRQDPEKRSESPTMIVRTVGTVLRHTRDLPWGIRLIRKISDRLCPTPSINRDTWYRVSVLVITYLSYCAYHLSRKPISIVKGVLKHNNCSVVPGENSSTWCDWPPFGNEPYCCIRSASKNPTHGSNFSYQMIGIFGVDGADAETLLGTLDSSFLFAYAFGMFISGFVAERVNLRYFLSLGMLLSGFFTYLFGLAYTKGIHSLSYFILVQALAGFFQTTGWPGVVTVVGNWFGKGKRGLIFGIWNSHTSLGNILGSIIAGVFVEDNWGLSLIVPGAIVGFMGFVVFLFLVPKPQHVGCEVPDHHGASSHQASHSSGHPANNPNADPGPSSNGFRPKPSHTVGSDSDDNSFDSSESNFHIRDDTPLMSSYLPIHTRAEEETTVAPTGEVKIKAVGFRAALQIPGVIEFSLCLFFAKLVSYTFLYWLPFYIKNTTSFSVSESGNLSTMFDVGGIFGAIIAGVISDYSGMSATTCAGMLSIATPMLFIYQKYASYSLAVNIALLIIVGVLVNGPYALITTAVSAELGTHPCLQGNARALATVTAIIDGTGSVGAAVGPLLAGSLSTMSWHYVFYMLMGADILALVLLVRLVTHEMKRYFHNRATAGKSFKVRRQRRNPSDYQEC